MQTASCLDDNLYVVIVDQKRAPEYAPLPFPQSESTLHRLPVERQKVVVVTLSFRKSLSDVGCDNVVLADESIIANNEPVATESAIGDLSSKECNIFSPIISPLLSPSTLLHGQCYVTLSM